MEFKKIVVLFCSLAALVGIVLHPQIVQADDGIGGQVRTNGKISFYEDGTQGSTTGTTDSTPTTSTSEPVKKPIGKLPSTGELIQKFSLIGATIVGLFLMVVFLRKRRKEERS